MKRNSENTTETKQEVKPAAPAQTETQANSSTSGLSSTPYAEMLRQASKLQTAYRTGATLTIPGATATSTQVDPKLTFTQAPYRIPGVAVYKWYPTAGVATQPTDPINMAIKSIYSFVRSANSGARNYQPSDLFIYTTALDSIYSLYFQIARVMGLLNLYTEHNVYYPEALVHALGFDYADFVENQPAILFQMANWAAKLRQFALPNSMRLYQDHRDMNTIIFTDGDTDRAQMYAFVQDGFWTYEAVDEVKGLTLRTLQDYETSDIVSQLHDDEYSATWAATKGLFNAMLSAFLTSDDVALISGDITKAYQTAGFVDLPIIGDGYTTPIGKSDMMLHSIMNADVLAIDPATCRVEDAPGAVGYVTCTPGFDPGNYWINIAKRYAANKAANPAAVAWHNPATAHLSDREAFPAQAGNTYWENFVSNTPTEDELVGALRFRVWIDESSIESLNSEDYQHLFDGYSAQELTMLNDMLDDFTGDNALMWNSVRYKLKYCGTELIHDCYITSLYDDDSIHALAKDTFAIGGTFHAPTFMPLTTAYDTWTANATKTSPPTWTIGPNTAELAQLGNLLQLASFDWHHRVYPVDYFTIPSTGTANQIFVPFFDAQNVVPIGEANVQQYIDAALYYAFFG